MFTFKPEVYLDTVSPNLNHAVGRCRTRARAIGVPAAQLDEFTKAMFEAPSWEAALAVAREWFIVREL